MQDLEIQTGELGYYEIATERSWKFINTDEHIALYSVSPPL